MIVDYTSLQAAVADYLGRSDLTTQIQTFINQGEASIYRDLRVADMLETISGNLTNNTFAVPADYLQMQGLYISTSDGLQPLERADYWWMQEHYPTQSAQTAPYYYSRQGQQFLFAPYPDQAYAISGQYYGRLPSLSVANPTNWLVTKNPDLIMAAAMREAATYLADDQAVQYWTQRYQAIVQAAQAADRRERYSGSPLAIRNG